MDDFFRALDFHKFFFENVALAQRFGPVLKSMISGAQKGNELQRNWSKNGAKTNFKMSTCCREKRSVLFWCENVALGHEIHYFLEHGKRSREAQSGSQNVDLVSKETLGCENVALGLSLIHI